MLNLNINGLGAFPVTIIESGASYTVTISGPLNLARSPNEEERGLGVASRLREVYWRIVNGKAEVYTPAEGETPEHTNIVDDARIWPLVVTNTSLDTAIRHALSILQRLIIEAWRNANSSATWGAGDMLPPMFSAIRAVAHTLEAINAALARAGRATVRDWS